MTQTCDTTISGSLKAFTKALEDGAKAGIGVLQSMTGSAPAALDNLIGFATSKAGARGCSTCDIPPPCWMPRQLCEVTSYGQGGDTTTVTFAITNCSMANRNISIFTTTSVAGLSFSSTALTLGAMERGWVDVTFTIPTTLTSGPGIEILLWVRGCKLHFLRWAIKLAPVSANTSYEVDVEDCAELVHHWYDHFYCPRPCLPDQRVPGQ